ncbi:hypothetical protein KEM48_010613 [Puccinia striiformis f. sp. tritici PST-130]|uniref:Uncharacterized protein n=1 Tax=Puccinia striiformis f. sp. tritici PST-78 TaxID=1165861 RepID=A0A0L0VX43_9BASI|nr:hypothetical protein KEM48_010613 [Puccinia striiformis f. sp. tritici PST-130]KNF03833.1 hypothetical protein PSTG_02926 [Puccinia striiformis f. sp. tritici PST-78]
MPAQMTDPSQRTPFPLVRPDCLSILSSIRGRLAKNSLSSICAGSIAKSTNVITPSICSRRPWSSTTTQRSDSLFVHRDSSYNNPQIPFEFTPEYVKKAQRCIE